MLLSVAPGDATRSTSSARDSTRPAPSVNAASSRASTPDNATSTPSGDVSSRCTRSNCQPSKRSRVGGAPGAAAGTALRARRSTALMRATSSRGSKGLAR